MARTSVISELTFDQVYPSRLRWIHFTNIILDRGCSILELHQQVSQSDSWSHHQPVADHYALDSNISCAHRKFFMIPAKSSAHLLTYLYRRY